MKEEEKKRLREKQDEMWELDRDTRRFGSSHGLVTTSALVDE
jgi:hypothetical protein